jgi:hypothetical protein
MIRRMAAIAPATLAVGLVTPTGPANAHSGTGSADRTHAAPTDLPYGPYTCKSGFVWRNAVPGDQVCVTPQANQAAAAENALAPSRRSPNGGPWGPDTCLPGYVWRGARPSDHACVPSASRDRVAGEDGYPAVSNLADPTATPQGGLRLSTVPTQLGTDLYASGGGMSPNSDVYFYAIGNYWQTTYALDFVGTDGNGNIADGSYLGDVWCRPDPLYATVIVDDRSSGMVTTVGWFTMAC